MAERSKQRKVDAENLQFNKEWTDKWLFVLPVGGMKPMCLICNATVAVVKSCSVKRHYKKRIYKARHDGAHARSQCETARQGQASHRAVAVRESIHHEIGCVQ